jgi:hypothetical protein
MPCQCLIDRVIYSLENHVVQTSTVIGITNVHSWPLADSIEAF